MAGKLIHIFKGFLDFLFPQKCLGCGAKNVILCEKCSDALPFPEEYFSYDFQGRSPAWIIDATSYKEETVKKAIRLFKYQGVKILAEPLADFVFRRTKNKILERVRDPNQALIIPIPLSRKRLKQRGYNQTELLGRFLSDRLSVRMAINVLYKIRETISQVEIKDRDKRLKNIQGVFKVENPEIIKNKAIILIDDITTTGATLKEAKRVLTQAGAKRVIGLVVAKG